MGDVEFESPHPAAARPSPLAHETIVTADGPHPLAELGAVARCVSLVVLAGRATRVPFTAVSNGPERTITDNATAAATCAPLPASWVTAPPDLALGAPSTNAHEFVDHPARAGVVNTAQKVRRRPGGADEAEVRSSGKRCPTFRQYGG
jgi:hypothetical protein